MTEVVRKASSSSSSSGLRLLPAAIHLTRMVAVHSTTYSTDAFCSNMNELFDIFNSSRFDESVSARRPLSSDSNHFQLLDDHADWLKTVRVLERVTGKDITNRFKCINGWLQAINALKLLWDDISCSTKFLFTRRINQDTRS